MDEWMEFIRDFLLFWILCSVAFLIAGKGVV